MSLFPVLPKIFKWILKSLIISTIISLIASYFLSRLFIDNFSLDFVFIFFFGFFVSSLIFLLILIKVLYPLGRSIERIKVLATGKGVFDKNEDSFLREPGEFYDFNKNLNQINDYLTWQKKVINQESSELEAVISAVTGAILAVDKNKKVLFFNNQAIMLFAPNKKAKAKELFLSEIIRSPDILNMYQECLKSDQIIRKTLPLRTFDAEEEIIYEITVAPFEDTNDKVGGAVGLFYDITNIKKTEQVQVDFISNVSHELRTPLTAIQGYVQTLLSQIDTNQKDQIKKFLTIISRNVERLVSLLNHFLELSQMEASMELKKEELFTEEITQSIVKDLHIKNHKIKLDFSAKKVKADKHFLKQVLYNLLDNAIRYVPKGRLIEVIWSEDNNNVILTVKDHGEGIPSQHKDRLFERFYRVDPSRKQTRGVGIGLSIVKKLIEKHGGDIKIVSEAKEGSSFICTFPKGSSF